MLRDLARAMARHGWDVTVVTTGPQAARQRDGSVRIIRLKADPDRKGLLAYLLVWIRMLWTGFRLGRSDLIVTMTDPPMLIVAGRILATIRRTHHIHWCHDLYPDLLPALGVRLPGPVMKFFKTMTRKSMRSCSRIIVIGRCMAKALTYTGVDPRKIAVIPNWTDAEVAGRAPKSSPGGRKYRPITGAKPWSDLFKDTDPKFRVLYAGTLGKAHPVGTILDAAEILAHAHPEIEFTFVGDGPGQERLAQERARRGLDNIRLLPYQPVSKLRELMESGDLHLISMAEAAAGLLVPCKLYSALAAGRPCLLVGPAQCETAKVINDFHAGAVVPQGQGALLADTIRRFRLEGDMWFQAQQGAEEAGRIFLPEESIRAWIERAVSVVNGGPPL